MFWRRKSSKTPALQRPDPLEPVHPRVLLAVYNPSCARRGGRLLVEVCGFNDPLALTRQYVDDLAELSGGYLRYQIVETLQVERFLPKVDGFCYDADDFLARWEGGGPWHEPDSADYHTILAQLDVPRRVAAGELDELWLMTMPYSGLWESAMAGRGAYFCNAPPIEGVSCRRPFIVMGFNYERGVGEMLENFGHRVESMLSRAFGSWREWGGTENHPWDRFSAYDAVASGQAGCGNVHFAPNSVRDYDWGNPTPVWSTCDSWPAYPAPLGEPRRVDCREWGNGEVRAHHRWWLAHLPRSAGETDGVRNHWWSYVVEP